MMKIRKNGFMTAYMLGMGMTVLSLAISSSMLAFAYLQTAKQYKESIQLGYVAESAVLLDWDDIRQCDWQQVPKKKKRRGSWKMLTA